MISELLKSGRMADNSMMAVSAALHLLALVGIVVMSYSFAPRSKVVGPVVTNVKLIESGAPRIEMARPQTTLIEPAVNHVVHEFTEPATAHTPPQERLTSTFSEARPVPTLQMEKRKKPAQKIPEQKIASNKKPAPPKEPDNSKYLEKRLTELRSKMQERKSDAAPQEQPRPANTSSGRVGASSADAEMSRWFELVKNKVNTHWSLLGDQTKLDKITVVGVQITEEGKLIEASIDSSSGDKLFDNSALRAVFHAAPFPPVPQDVSEKIKQSGGLALRFTPGGMQ